MQEDVARSVLRIVGIATILVGLILTLQAIFVRMALSQAIQAAPAGIQVQATGKLGDLGGFAIVAQAMIIVAGFILYFVSSALAKHVAE